MAGLYSAFRGVKIKNEGRQFGIYGNLAMTWEEPMWIPITTTDNIDEAMEFAIDRFPDVCPDDYVVDDA